MSAKESSIGYGLLFSKALYNLAIAQGRSSLASHLIAAKNFLGWDNVNLSVCMRAYGVLEPYSKPGAKLSLKGLNKDDFRALVLALLHLQHQLNSGDDSGVTPQMNLGSGSRAAIIVGDIIDALFADPRLSRFEAAHIKATRGCTLDDLNDPLLISVCSAS